MRRACSSLALLRFQRTDLLGAFAQNRNGARHLADLVGTIGVRDVDLRLTRRQARHHSAKVEDRAGDGALAEDRRDDEGHDQAGQQDQRQQPVDHRGEGFGFRCKGVASGLVAVAEGDEQIVQRLAVGAVQLVIALRIGGFRRNLAAQPHRLGAEGDEFIDRFRDLLAALPQLVRQGTVQISGQGAQGGETRLHALGEGLGILGGLGDVDTARIHHDSEHARVDPLREQGDVALCARALVQAAGALQREQAQPGCEDRADGDDRHHRQEFGSNGFHCSGPYGDTPDKKLVPKIRAQALKVTEDEQRVDL